MILHFQKLISMVDYVQHLFLYGAVLSEVKVPLLINICFSLPDPTSQRPSQSDQGGSDNHS